MENKLKKTQNEFIIGRNSIKEALNAGRSIEYILISNSAHNRIITDIITRAKKLKIPIKISDTKKLNSLCQNANHQGIIAVVAAHKYVSIDEIFDVAHKKNKPPFIIVFKKYLSFQILPYVHIIPAYLRSPGMPGGSPHNIA